MLFRLQPELALNRSNYGLAASPSTPQVSLQRRNLHSTRKHTVIAVKTCVGWCQDQPRDMIGPTLVNAGEICDCGVYFPIHSLCQLTLIRYNLTHDSQMLYRSLSFHWNKRTK